MQFHCKSPPRRPPDLRDIFRIVPRSRGIPVDFMISSYAESIQQDQVEEEHSSCQRKESLREILASGQKIYKME